MATPGAMETRSVQLPAAGVLLEGDLNLPPDAAGVVLFAHGSGSGRHSSRNRMVARLLNERGLATLLIDLLTAEEDAIDRYTAQYRFNIPLLAERLVGATHWLAGHEQTQNLPVGIFGASTGGGAGLIAAVAAGGNVRAVVSRGGRPDLAGSALPQVRAPTLLIVGGEDPVVIDLNRAAYALLNCEKDLIVIPGATHLFEEPGALEEVARLAGDWFLRHLR
jgi:dienelactone hydrolase